MKPIYTNLFILLLCKSFGVDLAAISLTRINIRRTANISYRLYKWHDSPTPHPTNKPAFNLCLPFYTRN